MNKVNHIISQYYIEADVIKTVNKIKDLGVTFDDRMTFTYHIDDVISRINKLYGAGFRFIRDLHAPR